jgi:hypothetical protein
MGSESDPDTKTQPQAADAGLDAERGAGAGAHDVAILPEGVLDPVYDAKARVLNKAVRFNSFSSPYALICQCKGKTRGLTAGMRQPETDSRHWHGMVSMAALHRRRLRLGQR